MSCFGIFFVFNIVFGFVVEFECECCGDVLYVYDLCVRLVFIGVVGVVMLDGWLCVFDVNYVLVGVVGW